MSARITITGVDELVSYLKGFATKLPQAGKRSIEKSMDEAEQSAKNTVHVVSGKLKGSIQSKMEGNEKGIMGPTAEYGNAEENRGGPHRFIEPTYQKVSKTFPDLYVKELNSVIG